MNLNAGSAAQPLIRPVMPELDSLRGVAILLVLFFHGFDYPDLLAHSSRPARIFLTGTLGGWTGVYLFFVLSGFLITGILVDSKPKPQYFRRFYIRRALRILPPFYLLLALLIILPRTGWLAHRRVGLPFIGLSFLYLANVTELLGVPAQYAALWSLAVEEHFYLIWPAVVRALSRRAVAWCAAAIFLMSPVIRAATYYLGYNADAGYTWLVADGLAIGSLVGVLSRGRLAERGAMRWFSVACVAGGVGLLAFGAPFGIWRGSRFAGAVFRLSAVDAFCAGVLGITLLLGTSRYRWIVQRPILRRFGEISYGLYLMHMLAFDFVDHWIVRYSASLYARVVMSLPLLFVRFFVSMGLAVLVAFLSRRYFEEWFLKLKDRWTPSASSPQRSATIAMSPQPERRTA